MPEPQAHSNTAQILRVARHALYAGLAVTLAKFLIFAWTDSAAVLSDALESIINVVAAGFMLYTLWFANRPADREHPYGHGKIEFMAVGLESWLILLAGVAIIYEAVWHRLIRGEQLIQEHLQLGLWFQGGMGLVTGGLAMYVWIAGRRYQSPALIADGKHLMTDCASTVGVLVGLLLVHYTGKMWLDPIVALLMAGFILATSWRLLWQFSGGLMDKRDPEDDAAIRAILDEEVATGAIRGYHKVRQRHSGSFHWVDMHLQVDPTMNVRQSHEIASRIEGRIAQMLGQANATAHVEPFEGTDRKADDPTAPSVPKVS